MSVTSPSETSGGPVETSSICAESFARNMIDTFNHIENSLRRLYYQCRQQHASFFVLQSPDSDTGSRAGWSFPPQQPSIITPICIKLIWLKRPTFQDPRIDLLRQILIGFETKCADYVLSSSTNIQLTFLLENLDGEHQSRCRVSSVL